MPESHKSLGKPLMARGDAHAHGRGHHDFSREPHDFPLMDHIYRWKLRGIMDDELLRSKLTVIPKRFSSESEYLQSFKWPFLEEVRANISQALQGIADAPVHAPISEIHEILSHDTHCSAHGVYAAKLHYVERCPFKSKDLLLLTSSLPRSPEELLDSDRDVIVALSKQRYKDDIDDKPDVELLLSMRKADARHYFSDPQKIWYAIYLGGLATSFRIWDALHCEDRTMIKCILDYPRIEKLAESESPGYSMSLRKGIQAYCRSACSLNESQTNAVTCILDAVKERSHSGVHLIQGPPGTGKTSTIVSLLSIASCIGFKCLVTAPTNVAITGVATRFLELLKSSQPQFAEVFSQDFPDWQQILSKVTGREGKILQKSDIVLVGNIENLKLKNSVLLEIHLQRRVKKVTLAWQGWRQTADRLWNLLASSKTTYEEHIEEWGMQGKLSYREFLKVKLNEFQNDLRRHGDNLVEELPSGLTEVFTKTQQSLSLSLSLLVKSVCGHSTRSENIDDMHLIEQSQYEFDFLENSKDLLEELKSLRNLSYWKGEEFEKLCMRSSSLVFSTVSIAGGFQKVGFSLPFDCVIVDEAAQLVEAETTILTCTCDIKKVVLVGDPQQLPATVISKAAVNCEYGRSLFERLNGNGLPSHLLNTQYRMHPSLSLFPNLSFYGGRLINGENVRNRCSELENVLYGPYAFIDVNDAVEQSGSYYNGNLMRSKRNFVEALVVLKIIKQLQKVLLAKGTSRISVGIITPYSSQKKLFEDSIDDLKLETLTVDINSVDGFQGQERDVILLSTVRANKEGNIGFLKDQRRLNVAITRARHCLWIVGSKRTLCMQPHIWRKLLQDVDDRGLCKSAANDPVLQKQIIKAKEDMGEFLDLIQPGSALFSSAIWKVTFSNEFKNSLINLKSREKRMKVLGKINYLSLGCHFSKNKVKLADQLTDGLLEIVQVSGLYLLWTIDVNRYPPIKQIIKIWDLINPPDLAKYVRRVVAAFNVYSPEYLKRCRTRNSGSDNRLTLPETWEDDADFVWIKSHASVKNGHTTEFQDENLEHSTVQDSLLLMKFYSLSSGIVEHLLSATDGSEVNLTFEVNKEEAVIIQHPSSCFVLGRSGTGKTTVIVTKLLQREQRHLLSHRGFQCLGDPRRVSGCETSEREICLRQIIVTVSPYLCSAIRSHMDQIRRSMVKEGGQICSNTDNFDDLILDSEDEERILGFLPSSLTTVPSTCYPMVLTYRKFLMMLENSVLDPVHKGKEELRPSLLTDNDIGAERSFMLTNKTSNVSCVEIDFEHFDMNYWPHLNANFTKGLDSSTIFTEIMSVIKGSVEAIKADNGILSRDAYLSYKGVSKGNTLDINQRENVYNLFLQYEKLKKKTRAYDLADHVWHVYKHLAAGKYRGDKMDFIYVDEVQDFTLAQLSLFGFITSNPQDGFLFAGDTAQVITRGVNFRFQDARTLFYKDFGQAVESIKICGPGHKVANQGVKDTVLPIFQLSQNFRTHTGVVNMANSIVNLLYHFFPLSIDKLQLETSLVSGELPILLNTQGEQLVKMVFGSAGDVKMKTHEFGANQVILVRDEDQKRSVLDKSGAKGLVLTITGSKGLEFQDVLVYNFFTGSLLRNKWRVIYEYIEKTNYKQMRESYPKFDIHKHYLLCSELKHLYVAVTRARQRLWFYEEDEEFCRPMLDYWIHSGLIETKFVDESFITKMISSSTPEEWKKTGVKLYNQKQFDMAIICFERAGDEEHALLAKAARLQQTGERQLPENPLLAVPSLREAAKLFLSAGRPKVSAECLIKIGDFQKAANIYMKNFQPPRFENAGGCFEKAEMWMDAANAYFKARCPEECLNVCLQGCKYELGLTFLQKWGKEAGVPESSHKHILSEEIKNAYLQKCAENYHKNHDVATMMNFVNSFSDMKLKRQFLRENGYIDELLKIEEMEKNYAEAAALAELKGDIVHMAELLEKGNRYGDAAEKLLFLIRKDLIWAKGSKGCGLRTSEHPIELLQKVKDLAEKVDASLKRKVQLEMELMSMEQPQNLEELRTAVKHAECQFQTSIKFKLLALWNAFNGVLKILEDSKRLKLNAVDAMDVLRDIDHLLVLVLYVWKEWRNTIICFRESLHDESMQEFYYDFFAVTKLPGTTTCRLLEQNAFWLQSYEKRIPANGTLPVSDFKLISHRYLEQQLRHNDEKISVLFIKKLNDLLACVRNGRVLRIGEKVEVLLRLGNLTCMPYVSSRSIEAFLKDLHTYLLLHLWPLAPQPEELCLVLYLREETRATAILDQIGDNLIANYKGLHTEQESGLLLLISPYLSGLWKKKHASLLNSEAFYWGEEFWCQEDSTEGFQVAKLVSLFAQPLIDMFNMGTWRNVRGYISPCVFIELLEIAAATACAYSTCLHAMYLPLTVALSFFCGKRQDLMIQKILGAEEQCSQNLYTIVVQIVVILRNLLSHVNDTKTWLQNDNVVGFSQFNRRALVMLLFISVNIPSVSEFQNIPKFLSTIDLRNSELQEFTSLFRRPKQMRTVLTSVLSGMGSFLVMTRRCTSVRCCMVRNGIRTINLHSNHDSGAMLAYVSGPGLLNITPVIKESLSKTEEFSSTADQNTQKVSNAEDKMRDGVVSMKEIAKEPKVDDKGDSNTSIQFPEAFSLQPSVAGKIEIPDHQEEEREQEKVEDGELVNSNKDPASSQRTGAGTDCKQINQKNKSSSNSKKNNKKKNKMKR